MPFERLAQPPRRIAVIGSGISGLAAADLLSHGNAVVLFEAERRLGGHARTILAGRNGDQPVDTGFIVFNRATYPLLSSMFDRLGVPIADSDMSFGVSAANGRIEYGLRDLGALLSQPANAVRPAFLRMLRDILRFNANAEAALRDGLTIGSLVDALGLGRWFRDYYLAPLTGAIWSTPTRGVWDFPAEAIVRFLRNHGLLSYSGQHQWLTVRGGSVEYVRRLEAALRRAGVEVRTSAPVAGIRRIGSGVEVRTAGGEWELFDDVVLATHSDDSLRMLSDPSPAERRALSAIRYQPNEAVLHSDPALMPRRRRAWASWVYAERTGAAEDRIALTYWMNSLQPIPADDPLFVTLNATAAIRPDLIQDVTTFRHPVYDLGALAAQADVRALNGARNTWFCGAWLYNGFHEDGFRSAVDVADGIAVRAERQAAA